MSNSNTNSAENCDVCPACGKEQPQKDSIFCAYCGISLKGAADVNVAAEATVPAQTVVYVESPVVFASGLPAWNIEPPSVVVRRKARI